jgi:hypothetical protein
VSVFHIDIEWEDHTSALIVFKRPLIVHSSSDEMLDKSSFEAPAVRSQLGSGEC